jgi:hypothetical protein
MCVSTVAKTVVAMSFDTTATGLRNGACCLIEQKLDRKLPYTACRHHVNELSASLSGRNFFCNCVWKDHMAKGTIAVEDSNSTELRAARIV